MSTVLSVELPEEIMEFVRVEAAANGMGEAQDYVIELLRKERVRKIREYIADAIDEGLQGESREMTEADWEALRQRIRERSSVNGEQP
ncbi:MAG: hypothetical protein SGJ19_16270 [Planctomycetia bacterium]|nr:hypothetical protein [Planctomycetia bacterium]